MEVFLNLNNKDDLNNKIFNELLKKYQSIIETSIGQFNSYFKLIHADQQQHVILTNSSGNLIQLLYNINHIETSGNKKLGLLKWKLELINSVVKSLHCDHYYDSGLFLFNVINQSLLQTSFVGNKLLFDSIFQRLYDHISKDKSDHITINVNLNDIKFLKTVLTSVMDNKLILKQYNQQKRDYFINLFLRACINSFNNNNNSDNSQYFSRIVYLFNQDSNSDISASQLFNGLLIKLSQQQTENELEFLKDLVYLKQNRSSLFRCLLFDTNELSGDLSNIKQSFEIINDTMEVNRSTFLMLNQLYKALSCVIDKYKVDIIFCQKVIIKLEFIESLTIKYFHF
jgi:hypothetical protein